MKAHVSLRTLLMALLAAALAAGCQMVREPAEAAGPEYVRVEKIDGRHWFVHRGRRFLSLGVNAVHPRHFEPQGFRMPSNGRFYDVLPKFAGDRAAWARDVKERFDAWNFTTVAGFSDPYLYSNAPIYNTQVIWLGEWGSRDSRLIDVFSERYEQEIDRTALQHVAPHAGNEYLIGYFINNELPWYGEKAWPTTPTVSLLSRYMHLPPSAPGKMRLVEYLKEAYSNDFAAFTANWEVNASSFEELAAARQLQPRTRQARKDTIPWAGIVADRYYQVCRDAIRKYDPNHLVLGSRFSERAQEPVMAACAKYCDVISLNHYQKGGHFDDRKAGAIAALTGKPIMITEFSWRAMENTSGCPNTHGADVTVETQADRARAFRTYATNALAQPYLVGYDWFCYFDEPPSGRFDGEDSNYGLVDIHDQFYTTLLGAITEVNGQAARYHETGSTAPPLYNADLLADYRDVTVPGADTPLSEPVVFVDSTCSSGTWGDNAKGATLDVDPSGSDTWRLSGLSGSGWGCGATFQPASALPHNDDGSVDVRGATRVAVVLKARAGLKFSVGIQESGHGEVNSQAFDGFGTADGESYVYPEIAIEQDRERYVFDLVQAEPSTSYGNQRGNYVVDTDAIAQVHLYFPGSQGEFEVELVSLSFE